MIFNLRPILELEIDGEEKDNKDIDYTDEAEPDDTEDNENEADDYTEEELEEDEEDDTNDADDDTDTTSSGTTDYTKIDDAEEDSEESADDASGDDATSSGTPDYTKMDDDAEEDVNDSDDNEGEDADENAEEDVNDSDDNEGEDAEEEDEKSLSAMEKNLFSDLSPAQMAIKSTELIKNYVDLYETLNNIFANINKITKTYNNSRLLDFISDKVVELRDRVNYIITDTYLTRTYVENLVVYTQCLSILHQISTMLKNVNKIDSANNNNRTEVN